MKWLALFAVAFVYLLALPMHWPPRNDARHYVYASQSLMAGRGLLLDSEENPNADTYYAVWPPLQPIVLAGLQALGLSAYTAVRLLNATCYALTVVLVGYHSRSWLVLALFTPVFTASFQYALSEPLFILLTTAFFVLLFRPRLPLVALAVIGALLVMQRYSGVVVIGVGAGAILIRYGTRQALFFVLLPAVTLGAWMLRNLALIGAPFGERLDPRSAWAENSTATAAVLMAWAIVLGGIWILQRAFSWLLSRLTRHSSSSPPAPAG